MIKEFAKKFLPKGLLGFYYQLYPFLGALRHCFPSKKLIIIGVTGTNGKSTVVHLVSAVLKEAGFSVASMSSVRFQIKGREWKNMLKMTMPGRFLLQKFLSQAVKSGCKYAVLEVTSEGIKQFRHKFIDFDVAVFTNLTKEHIESHGNFENYRKAKEKLFKATKNIHIINTDDNNAKYFLEFPAKEKYLYCLKNGFSQIKAIDQNSNTIKEIKELSFDLQLPGEFNLYNATAAICVGISQGIDLDICKKAVEKAETVPGRMEKVISSPFEVFVDYAHTPDALQKVYQTLANLHKLPINDTNIREISGHIRAHSQLICVLGSCGGGRDKWKRKELGEIAANYCGQIILTNEDPYDENPMEIINQIGYGIKDISADQRSHQRKSAVFKILDRRRAIRKALELAKEGDIVIVTGKGSEPWMCVEGGKKISWDDRETVREEFNKLTNIKSG